MLFLLSDKTDVAFSSLVTASLAGITAFSGVQVVTGKDAVEKQKPPIVYCHSEVDDWDDPYGSGNYGVTATVAIKTGAIPNEDGTGETTAESVKEDNQSLVETVITALQVENLADQLTGATDDFTVFPGSIQFGGAQSGQDEKGVWIDSFRVHFTACGSRLA